MSIDNIFALEGPDGVGKTTVTAKLVERLQKDGRKTTTVRLPGSTKFGEEARKILLYAKDIPMSPMVLGLVFTATHVSVMELAQELAKDSIVIMDRSYWSNFAYRRAEGMDVETILRFNVHLPFALDPLHGLLLDAPLDVLKSRLDAARGDKPDRFEGRGSGFQAKVYEGYKALSDALAVTPFDANRTPDEVVEDLFRHVVANSPVGQAQQVFN